MKKFWIILVAAVLLTAFSVPAAFAVGGADVKISGHLLINGYLIDNPSLKKNDGSSAGVVDQRFRMGMEFKIAEGLKLVTRFDALEKTWGDRNWGGAEPQYFDSTNRLSNGNSGSYLQENIEWDQAYVDFTTGIGRFMVGYQLFTAWGTPIADGVTSKPGVKYLMQTGPWTLLAAWERNTEGQKSTAAGLTPQTKTTLTGIDVDSDAYDLGAIYKFKGGEFGVLYQFVMKNNTRAAGASTTLHVIDPYVKFTAGPVYFEGEAVYLTGKAAKYETPVVGVADVDADEKGIYLHAKVDLKPAYVGGMFLWVQGDDYGSSTKQNGGWIRQLAAGVTFEPCLLFGSAWYTHAGFTEAGYAGVANQYTYYFDNIWFAQGYAGFQPTPKWDVSASYSWMKADQKPRTTKGAPISVGNPEFVSDALGTEVDLKVKYKIFDNLTYMIGGAYFFTGDYFKGTSNANQIKDNYLIMHNLTLVF